MTGWEHLIFHKILTIKSYSFRFNCREVWTFYNNKFKLRVLRFFMLCHIADTSLQSKFPTSILHNDTRIKAFNVSNFNESRKWLAFCFENVLSQIATSKGLTSIFLPKFHEMWPTINHSLMPHKISMPPTMICFHIHASKVFTNSCNSTLLASLSIAVNPNLMINFSNHCSNIVITWIILWTRKFWCVENR